MKRRTLLATVALGASISGCLQEEKQYAVLDERVVTQPSPLELSVVPPLTEEGQPVSNTVTDDTDGELTFQLTNPTDEPVVRLTPPFPPFGVPYALHEEGNVPLWNDQYEAVEAIQTEDTPEVTTEDPVQFRLAPGESVSRTYEIRYENHDVFPGYGTFLVSGKLQRPEGGRENSDMWVAAFETGRMVQY